MCLCVCLFVCVTGINSQTRRATDLKFSQVNHYLMCPIVSQLIFLRNLLKGTFGGNHLWIISKVSYSKIMPHVSRIIFLQLLHYLWAKIMRHVSYLGRSRGLSSYWRHFEFADPAHRNTCSTKGISDYINFTWAFRAQISASIYIWHVSSLQA